MASTDASAYPIKNTAWRVTFPIFDADGDLVTGATGLDSEVSKDGGTFADCTNEATEIATSSGIYYLDLTSTEMNADTVAIIVKTTTVGAKTTAMVTYPITTSTAKLGVNVVQWLGSAAATPTVAGVPEVDVTHWIGTAAATPTQAGVPEVDVTYWLGGAVATPTTTGVPEVDLTHIAGAAVSTSTAQLGVNVVNFGGSAGTFASGIPAVNTTQWAGAATGASNLAMVSRITAGTGQAGGASTFTLAAGASAVDNIYTYSIVYLTGGTGAGQTGTIKSYNGTTKVATIFGAWGVAPDNTTTYTVIPGGYAADVSTITSGLATSVEVAAVQTTVDGIVTDVAAVQTTADAIEADTQDIQGRLPAALVSGRIDASVGAMAAGVITASALAADAVDEIWDEVMEGTTTARQSLRLANSANGAKLSGAATTTVAIRDLADSKDRVSATVDADGNRTAITLDLT